MGASLSVDRSSLSQPDLPLPSTAPASGLWTVSVGRPGRSWRRTYATSPYLHGSVQTEATLDVSSLAVTIGARAASLSDLYAVMTEAEEAFWQFTFPLTVTDGEPVTWQADCADISWADHSQGLSNAVVVTGTLTIPVYPIPGT